MNIDSIAKIYIRIDSLINYYDSINKKEYTNNVVIDKDVNIAYMNKE